MANVLFALCTVRIGVALTIAILSGLGASVAVATPLVFKGTGLFKDAPGITSPAGLTILAGVGVMLLGVVLASMAGFGRERTLKKPRSAHLGQFPGGARDGGHRGCLFGRHVAGVCVRAGTDRRIA